MKRKLPTLEVFAGVMDKNVQTCCIIKRCSNVEHFALNGGFSMCSRSVFGWSYPPGVSRLPWDDEGPCDVCGKPVDACICPECPLCQEVGNPDCYKNHGLEKSRDQKISRLKANIARAESALQDMKMDLRQQELGEEDNF